MSIATDLIEGKLRSEFLDNRTADYAYVAIDNDSLHELLNDESANYEYGDDWESWVMSDGSYIQRDYDGDEYTTGGGE